ncbi:ECF family sigma factor [Plesiocystis pacifica SIR-1]|uniref:ECF family sigma factor n=1 Tax=Plesiocystis pacifica SIR-1 TaxID=391625 RepID=A6GIZ7_9BACT|nr:ECF family sigma factor [Plesiocystis pacifica SIR-1]
MPVSARPQERRWPLELTPGVLRQLDRELLSYFLHRTGSSEVARELRQEVWVAAHGYRGESSLRHYLFAIARRQLASHYRIKRRSLVPLPELRDELDVEHVVLCREVAAAVDRVPEPFRAALRQLLAGRDGSESAAKLGCQEPTLRSRLHRGRQALRAELRAGI